MSRYNSAFALLLSDGTCSSDGNVGKTTFVDSALIGLNDYLTYNMVEIISGNSRLETRDIVNFDSITGTITVDRAFSAQIVSGIGYRVFASKPENIPIQDTSSNLLVGDVVGNKSDTAAVPSNTTSLMAVLKKVHEEIGTLSKAAELFSKSGPSNVEIDDLVNYYLELYDIGDSVPTTLEITPGNYQIDGVRSGVLTNIVALTAASEADGRIYCTETFDAASGWAIGDLVLVTFSGGSIALADGTTTTLPNAYFYTRIVRGESIESKLDDAAGTGFVTLDDSLHAISTEISEILDLIRTGADISVTTAETNLFIDDAPSKIINGLSIKIDTTDMQAGDTYEFREYYRIESAGSYIEIADTITLSDAQSNPLYVIHLEAYRYGCKITAKKTVGTDRAFPIEAIREE